MAEETLQSIVTRVRKLEKAVFGSGATEKSSKVTKVNSDINFSINERAFIKQYAADKSGPKKFVLLLAYLAQGEIDKNIDLGEIKKHWGKMTTKTLLGKFNMFYPNKAKTRGWADSKEYGSYCLTNSWKEIL